MESRVADLVHASIQHLQLLVESTGVFRQEKIERLSTLFIRYAPGLERIGKRGFSSNITNKHSITFVNLRVGDPNEIQRQKINLCTAIAIVAPAEVSLAIIDSLQKIAALDNIIGQLLSTRGLLDRQIIAGNITIACHAIESIARIACEHYSQTQAPGQNQDDSSSSRKDMLTTCLDVLFRLLAGFSGIEDLSLYPVESTGDTAKNNRARVFVHDLDLEDFHLSRLLSSLLTSIEGTIPIRYLMYHPL